MYIMRYVVGLTIIISVLVCCCASSVSLDEPQTLTGRSRGQVNYIEPRYDYDATYGLSQSQACKQTYLCRQPELRGNPLPQHKSKRVRSNKGTTPEVVAAIVNGNNKRRHGASCNKAQTKANRCATKTQRVSSQNSVSSLSDVIKGLSALQNVGKVLEQLGSVLSPQAQDGVLTMKAKRHHSGGASPQVVHKAHTIAPPVTAHTAPKTSMSTPVIFHFHVVEAQKVSASSLNHLLRQAIQNLSANDQKSVRHYLKHCMLPPRKTAKFFVVKLHNERKVCTNVIQSHRQLAHALALRRAIQVFARHVHATSKNS